MSSIVVRASDSAQAMEEIVRRLGEDALIISTTSRNGLIEITATNESMDTLRRPIPEEKNASMFEDMFAAHKNVIPLQVDQKKTPTLRRRADVIIDDDIELFPPEPVLSAPKITEPEPVVSEVVEEPAASIQEPQPVIVEDIPMPKAQVIVDASDFMPDVHSNVGGWPDLDAQFCAALSLEQSNIRRGRSTKGFMNTLIERLFVGSADRILAAKRIVLTGPDLAETSFAAVRIAAQMMSKAAEDAARPVIAFCGFSSRTDAGILATKARLLGLQPQYWDANALNSEPSEATEIVVIPAKSDATGQMAFMLQRSEQTQLILVLPGGLHPRAISQQVRPWSSCKPVAVMTRLENWVPSAEELTTLAGNNVPLAWTVERESILDCLAEPDRTDLCGWVDHWIGHDQNTQKSDGSFPEGVEKGTAI